MAEITIRISNRLLNLLLTLCTIPLLCLGLYSWSKGVFEPKYEIHAFLPDASQLQRGADVTLTGMPVGKVSHLELANDPRNPGHQILVTLQIQKRYQDLIRQDSVVSLQTAGLAGDRYVDISHGLNGAIIPAGGEIETAEMKELSTADLSKLIDALADLSKCGNQKALGEQPAKLQQTQQPH